MLKFRKRRVMASVAAGVILAGAMSTAVMAGSSLNEGNLLLRCRSMLCAEKGICRDDSQCMPGGPSNGNGVCTMSEVCDKNGAGNENGVCLENETCVNQNQCVTDENYTPGNHGSHQKYCENREKYTYHHGNTKNNGGHHGGHH